MILENSRNNTEQGSAIVWILVGVALFAALNFAFNSSSRTSTGFLSDSEASANANQIIAYGNEIKATIKRMQLNGCRDTEISFENNIVSGYVNPNSPADNSCHVFDIAGGALTWQSFEGSEVVFSGANVINGVGNDGAEGSDLAFFVRDIDQNTCININDNLNRTFSVNPPVDGGTWSQGQFIGDYTFGNNIEAVAAGLDSLKSACFTDDSAENIYYTALIVR